MSSRTDPLLLQRYCLALLQASRAWRRLGDQTAKDFGLSEATAYPLVFISRIGNGVRQCVLAEAIGIEGPSLVRLLDQLSAAGLVVRREDTNDKRAKTLHLTRRGIDLTEKLKAELDTARRRVFGSVSEDDLLASLRVFEALERAEAEEIGLEEAT